MTKYNRRVFEMLVRTLVFWGRIRESIEKDSLVDQLFRAVEAAHHTISSHATLEASERNNVRVSSEDRMRVRDQLRADLEMLSRVARSLGLKQFFMPRQKGDRAMADVAKVFVQLAEPVKDQFLKQHVPADFLDRLNKGIAAIEETIKQQVEAREATRTTATTIREAEAEAFQALTRLGPLVEQLLRGNEPLLAAWNDATELACGPGSRNSVPSPHDSVPSLEAEFPDAVS